MDKATQTQENVSPFKFNISELIERHHKTYRISKEEIFGDLARLCNVSTRQIYRWSNIKVGDKRDIGLSATRQIAKYFYIAPELLIND